MKYLAMFLMLGACAPAPTVFKPVTVDIPIARPCQSAFVEKPDFALSHISASDDLAAKMRAALVELDQRKAYEARLASVAGCSSF